MHKDMTDGGISPAWGRFSSVLVTWALKRNTLIHRSHWRFQRLEFYRQLRSGEMLKPQILCISLHVILSLCHKFDHLICKNPETVFTPTWVCPTDAFKRGIYSHTKKETIHKSIQWTVVTVKAATQQLTWVDGLKESFLPVLCHFLSVQSPLFLWSVFFFFLTHQPL